MEAVEGDGTVIATFSKGAISYLAFPSSTMRRLEGISQRQHCVGVIRYETFKLCVTVAPVNRTWPEAQARSIVT